MGEQTLENIVTDIDTLSREHIKFVDYQRQVNRQHDQVEQIRLKKVCCALAQRDPDLTAMETKRLDAEARGLTPEEVAAEEEQAVAHAMKPYTAPSRLESMLLQYRIGGNIKNLGEFAASSVCKLYLAEALQK
jgi:hypothetical protein